MRNFISAVLLSAFLMTGLSVLSTPASAAASEEMKQAVREVLLNDQDLLAEALVKVAQKYDLRLLPYRKQLFEDPMSPIGGNPKGDVVIVEFLDYNCGYCKKMHPIVNEVIASDPGVKVVYKEIGILHESSKLAAIAALAADRQGKHKEMAEKLVASTKFDDKIVRGFAVDLGLDMLKFDKDLKDPALADHVEESKDLGVTLGIRGTPAFLIGRGMFPGAMSKEDLVKAIAMARDEK